MTEDQKKYKIEKTIPKPYLNELGEVVSGFSVRVRFFEFDELHDIEVSNISKETVQKAIESHLKDREDIRDLG